MAMYQHLLQTEVMAAGTVRIYLWTSQSSMSVPCPSAKTITRIGELSAALDIKAGTLEMDTLELDYIEDYTDSSDGFWFYTLKWTNPLVLQLTIDEGGGEVHLFFGIVSNIFGEIEELALVPNTHAIRSGRLTVVSMLSAMSLATVHDGFVHAIPTVTYDRRDHEDNYMTGRGTAVKVHTFMAALWTAGLHALGFTDQSIQANANVHFSACDLRWNVSGLGDFGDAHDIDGMYLKVNEVTDAKGLDDMGDWARAWGDALQCFQALCLQFSWLPIYYYDVANAQHKIRLASRYHHTENGNDTITMPTVPMKSSIRMENEKWNTITDAMMFSAIAGWWRYGDTNAPYFNATLADDTDIDAMFTSVLGTPATSAYESEKVFEYHTDTGGVRHLDTLTHVCCYPGGAFYPWYNNSLQAFLLIWAGVGQAGLPGMKSYLRDYSGMKATIGESTTHENVRLLNNVLIGSDYYFIKALEKNVTENTLYLELCQIG